MKICVLELNSASPELIFGDERLVNLRRFMDMGLYGRLGKSDSASSSAWFDQLAHDAKKSIVLGIPPNSVPTELRPGIEQLVTKYGIEFPNFSADRKDLLRDQIFEMSSKQWQVARHLLSNQEWDYFHYRDAGIHCVLRGFAESDSAVLDYYLWLDEQVGSVMESLDSETILLVVSCYAAPQTADAEASEYQTGMFLLAAPNCPLSGEYSGAHLLDIPPTLLDLAGRDIPESMPGRSLVAGMEKKNPALEDAASDQLIQERLAGLGYI